MIGLEDSWLPQGLVPPEGAPYRLDLLPLSEVFLGVPLLLLLKDDCLDRFL